MLVGAGLGWVFRWDSVLRGLWRTGCKGLKAWGSHGATSTPSLLHSHDSDGDPAQQRTQVGQDPQPQKTHPQSRSQRMGAFLNGGATCRGSWGDGGVETEGDGRVSSRYQEAVGKGQRQVQLDPGHGVPGKAQSL